MINRGQNTLARCVSTAWCRQCEQTLRRMFNCARRCINFNFNYVRQPLRWPGSPIGHPMSHVDSTPEIGDYHARPCTTTESTVSNECSRKSDCGKITPCAQIQHVVVGPAPGYSAAAAYSSFHAINSSTVIGRGSGTTDALVLSRGNALRMSKASSVPE